MRVLTTEFLILGHVGEQTSLVTGTTAAHDLILAAGTHAGAIFRLYSTLNAVGNSVQNSGLLPH